jgi:hypothetical protein
VYGPNLSCPGVDDGAFPMTTPREYAVGTGLGSCGPPRTRDHSLLENYVVRGADNLTVPALPCLANGA